MIIAVFGNKTQTHIFLNHLLEIDYKPKFLITLNKETKSKINISGEFKELDVWSKKNGIRVHYPSNYKLISNEDINFFKNQNFDIGFCLGWQRLIPEEILKTFKYGVFGWHGSGFQFPNGRGRSPINWSIRLELNLIYHNFFKYSLGVDDGEVFDTKIIKILDTDYISDVQSKALIHILESTTKLLKQNFKKKLILKSQPKMSFVTFPKLTEEDGWIQPRISNLKSSIAIVRSCSKPFPGSFLRIKSTKFLRIWKMKEASKVAFADKTPGMMYYKNDKFYLYFSDGLSEIYDYEIINKTHINSNFSSFFLD